MAPNRSRKNARRYLGLVNARPGVKNNSATAGDAPPHRQYCFSQKKMMKVHFKYFKPRGEFLLFGVYMFFLSPPRGLIPGIDENSENAWQGARNFKQFKDSCPLGGGRRKHMYIKKM